MKFIISSLFFLICFLSGHAQTTYTIDFSYKSLGSGCNVFSVNQTVDNYVHQSTIAFPNFVDNPDYYVNLPCKRNSASSQLGTEYQILFPFKKGYKYYINAYYRGTVSSFSEFYPMLAIGFNAVKKSQNTSTSCSGPQSVSMSGYTFSTAGSSFAWSASPIVTTGELTQDYQSLSVASVPWLSSFATGLQTVQVRKIQITEELVAPPPPTTGFEGNVYKNGYNNKLFLGYKGKYRELTGNTYSDCFVSSTPIIINSNPPSNLLGDLLAPTEGLLYDGEITDLGGFFIIDQANNKTYFAEAKRNTYPVTTINVIEFHCTDISDPAKFAFYKFRSNNIYVNWNLTPVFDGQTHSLGGGAQAYFILSPPLP